MFTHVTVSGHCSNTRFGRMVLSDLDQIKKNERDRRRRLRLEQVRQQSKEISDRILERTKNITKAELGKIKDNDKLNFKQPYNNKIMEVQQKYQEDMADIGQAHISAAAEPDHNKLIEEAEKKNRLAALKRGKVATKQLIDAQKQETVQQQQHERLRQVRELENMRSTMVANLSQKIIPEISAVSVPEKNNKENRHLKVGKKKTKKVIVKRSPVKITKTPLKVVEKNSQLQSPILRSNTISVDQNAKNDCPGLRQPPVAKLEYSNENCKGEDTCMPVTSDKTARYNPEDYVQKTSGTTSDNSSFISDDSSYFSDNSELCTNRKMNMAKCIKCPATNKVQIHNHDNHQNNICDQPLGVVEKIHTWNEPSAMDLAQELERAKIDQAQLIEIRKQNAQKRGEDAALREKVRRDYQNLLQNLNHLAGEERKLKSCQVNHYPKNVYIQEEHRKVLRDQHKKKLNRVLKSLVHNEQCTLCSEHRPITLAPKEKNTEPVVQASWDNSPSSEMLQEEQKDNSASREEQILDMLKKVERQKRLLLQEFGTTLPNDIFNASIRSLFERDKSVHTQTEESQDTNIARRLSPEIKVLTVSPGEKRTKDENQEKVDPIHHKVETAVQTIVESKSIVQDKSVQVELEKNIEPVAVNEEAEVTHCYPLEPEIKIVSHMIHSTESTSSETVPTGTDNHSQSPKASTRKKKYAIKTKKTPSKTFQRSSPARLRKVSSPAKKLSTVVSNLKKSSPKKYSSMEGESTERIKMYVDKNGVNIRVNPPQVTKVAVDVSTQYTQVHTSGSQEQTITKSRWLETKSEGIQIKDVSDASTSFASPPSMKPRDLLEALSNNMSILELLDSSSNESTKHLKRDVSPVSTPETPSPRTMKVPSNIPHPRRLKKLLKYMSTEFQTNNETSSFSRNEYSTSTDMSEHMQHECLPRETVTTDSKSAISLDFCLCNNPECRHMHAKFDEIRNYALKNCPQILQKYEDLQTTCAERIVSLTNLIEKVRREQRGLEFSMNDPHDETSFMQLVPPQVVTNDFQSVRKLIETIETIYNQLASTLVESQKIINNKVDVKKDVGDVKEAVTHTNVGMATQMETSRVKPKIISEQAVNIQLNRFKVRETPKVLSATPQLDVSFPLQNHEQTMIQKLSREILQQSEGINNNLMISRETATANNYQASTDIDDHKNSSASKMQGNNRGLEKHIRKEKKCTTDFVPMLNDIPKVSKTVDTAMLGNNGRSKPPVSLLSGPYRSEIESSGHELSTIIEFDTPDTVHKSQNNRSPTSLKRIAEIHSIRPTPTKSFEQFFSSSHNVHNPCLEDLCSSSITKLSSIVSAHKMRETCTSTDSRKPSKKIENRTLIKAIDYKIENMGQETSKTNVQCDTINQATLRKGEIQQFCTETGTSKECKNDKDKITSTSSNSFSELSGVSQIASTPSSTILKYASSPEEMETALKKFGLGWAITTLKKTREASALSSSSNSDATPINTVKRIISPVKKQFDSNYGLLDFSDVSSISIKEASKSTEQAVLLKGRTSTPKLQNSNSNSGSTNTSNTNNNEIFQEPDDDLIIPNLSLTNIRLKTNLQKLENK